MAESRLLSRVHNASGCWVKTEEQMDEIAALGCIKTIVSKTCTLHPFDGNPTPNFVELGQLSLNCKGMPNFGYPYYRDRWKRYNQQGIVYVLSVDGADKDDLLAILKDYDEYLLQQGCGHGAPKEWVEVNVSCPNKSSKHEQPRLVSYDPEALDALLSSLDAMNIQCFSVLIKLAPFTDRWLLSAIAAVLARHSGVVRGVVCANSVPNAHSPGLARPTSGMSGLPAKLLAQANIAQLRAAFEALKVRMTLVGCGGVESLKDVEEYLALGAVAVQVGRTLHLEGRGKLADLAGVRLRASY